MAGRDPVAFATRALLRAGAISAATSPGDREAGRHGAAGIAVAIQHRTVAGQIGGDLSVESEAGKGTQITALNFGATPITETLHLPNIAPGPVVDIINERVEGDLTEEGAFTITLDAYEGLALRVVSSTPMYSRR